MKIQFFTGMLIAVIYHLKGTVAKRLECPHNNIYPWSFDGTTNGPSHWGEKFPDCKNGKMQSPIDIITSTTNKSIEPMELRNFNTPIPDAVVINAAETVGVKQKDALIRSFKVGKEFKKVDIVVFRFPCGHTIDGERYDLEVRFVHLTETGVQTAALAVLFKEVEEDNPAFQPVIKGLHKILYRMDETNLTSNFKLNGILPEDTFPIFQYEGSLAIPDCHQPVIWSIAKKIGTIGKAQMDEFRKLYSVNEDFSNVPRDLKNCRMNNNFRPTQPTNGRVVYEST